MILDFIGVDSTIVPAMPPETNAGGMPKNMMGRIRGERNPVHRFVRACVPLGLRARGRRLVRWDNRIARDFGKPPLTPEIRAKLIARYRDDVQETQELIGRDLGHWLEENIGD
jgi:hypothetical protein